MNNTPLTDAVITEIAASDWPEYRKLAVMQCHANKMELQQAATERLYRLLSEKHATLVAAHKALIERAYPTKLTE